MYCKAITACRSKQGNRAAETLRMTEQMSDMSFIIFCIQVNPSYKDVLIKVPKPNLNCSYQKTMRELIQT